MLSSSDGGLPIPNHTSALSHVQHRSNPEPAARAARGSDALVSLGRLVGFHALAFATSGLLLVLAKLGKTNEVEIFD